MTDTVRLAILTTHPIQYHVEWYRALAAHPALDIHVFYCHQASPIEQANAGFGVEFDWDVPLLSGYPHTFLKNVADLPGHGRFSGFDTPEIRNIIRQRKYDAMLVNGWHYKSAWQAIRACWGFGVKVIVRSDSHLYTPRPMLTRLAKNLVYRGFIPRFDGCAAVGKWSKEYFLHYGARQERVFIVPHAVNNRFFESLADKLTPERNELRKRWGLHPDAQVFAFAGKFIAEKRPMDFVKAVHESQQNGLSIQGLMVGDGPLKNACEDYVRAHNLPLQFTGFLNQTEIPAAYVASDVLVLSSEGETWGLVVNEAMACSRPCIVSDAVGCGPDLIVRHETGDIFPLGNVSALSQTMSEMAGDTADLKRMGVAANRKIHEYSVPTAVAKLVDCVRSVVHPGVPHVDVPSRG